MKDETKGAYAHGSLPGLKELFAQPNMDEVVRQEKEVVTALHDNGYGILAFAVNKLIEEREQKDAEIFNARSLRDFAVKKYNELEAKVAEKECELKEVHAMLTEQIEKRKQSTLHAIEQDKELQKLRGLVKGFSDTGH